MTTKKKIKLVTLTTAARGELRVSGRVITYDLAAGEHPVSEIDPVVLERLIAAGVVK